MARQIIYRKIEFIPVVTHFMPVGIPLKCLEEVGINLEEAEAIRLKDIENLEQEQCAEKMGISRQTFQRNLSSGRHKTADAIINGKAINIEGGHFEIAPISFRCSNGHDWLVQFDNLAHSFSQSCPICKTKNFILLSSSGQTCPCHHSAPCNECCPRLTTVANILAVAKTQTA